MSRASLFPDFQWVERPTAVVFAVRLRGFHASITAWSQSTFDGDNEGGGATNGFCPAYLAVRFIQMKAANQVFLLCNDTWKREALAASCLEAWLRLCSLRQAPVCFLENARGCSSLGPFPFEFEKEK